MSYQNNAELLDRRGKVNRNIDIAEMIIMFKMRNGLTPIQEIYDRESFRSEARDIHVELMKNYE